MTSIRRDITILYQFVHFRIPLPPFLSMVWPNMPNECATIISDCDQSKKPYSTVWAGCGSIVIVQPPEIGAYCGISEHMYDLEIWL